MVPGLAGDRGGVHARRPGGRVPRQPGRRLLGRGAGRGVQRGIRRREAQGRCPELVVIDHDPSRDARAFEPVVAALDELCPRIEILRPGRCALAARGPARYFGGEEAFWPRSTSRSTRCVPTGRAASGSPTVRSPPCWPPASTARRPEAQHVEPPGQSRAFLAAVPGHRPRAPGAGRPVAAPRPAPARRPGRPAAGAGAGPLRSPTASSPTAWPAASTSARSRPRVPPPDFSAAAELDPPADRVDRAAFVAKTLADTLHDELAPRGLACTRILIEAETEHGEELARLWRHDGALDRGRHRRAGAVAARRVAERADVGGPADVRHRQGPPHARRGAARHRPPARVLGRQRRSTTNGRRAPLARVQGMLGPAAVGTAVLQGGRSPAERARFVPWGDAREADRPELEADVSPWPGAVPPPAPAFVHAPPLAADVVDAAGDAVHVTGRGVCSGAPAPAAVTRVDGHRRLGRPVAGGGAVVGPARPPPPGPLPAADDDAASPTSPRSRAGAGGSRPPTTDHLAGVGKGKP